MTHSFLEGEEEDMSVCLRKFVQDDVCTNMSYFWHGLMIRKEIMFEEMPVIIKRVILHYVNCSFWRAI